MRRWRASLVVVAVVAAGALGTVVAGLAMGMGSDLGGIARALVPAAALTTITAVAGARALAHLSLRDRFLGIAVMAAAVALVNVFVLSRQMFVSEHDAALVAVVVLFAIGAGVAAALVAARRSTDALEVIAATAKRLGDGDLDWMLAQSSMRSVVRLMRWPRDCRSRERRSVVPRTPVAI